MKRKTHTKRSLLFSGVALLLCVVLLAATTFAWFTSVASNKGNRIDSGSLQIQVLGYDYDANSYAVTELEPTNDFALTSTEALISEENWEPSLVGHKYIEVKNNGTLDLKFKLQFSANDGGLEDVLLYRLVPVDVLGDRKDIDKTDNWKPMSELTSEGGEFVKLPVGTDSKFYRIDYKFCDWAGNYYQNKSFEADILVTAIQDIDDAKMTVVSTWDELLAAIAADEGSTIIFGADITAPSTALVLTIDKAHNFDLNGYKLDAPGVDISFEYDLSCASDIANGKIFAKSVAFNTPNTVINLCSDLRLFLVDTDLGLDATPGTGNVRDFHNEATVAEIDNLVILPDGMTGAEFVAAVEDLDDGAVAVVPAGIYNTTSPESNLVADVANLMITTDNITLIAEDPDNTIITFKRESGMGYRQQALFVAASNVTMDGFTFTFHDDSNPGYISIDGKLLEYGPDASGVIKNCTFDSNNFWGNSGDQAVGLMMGAKGAYTIINNNFRNSALCINKGAGKNANPDQLIVRDNLFDDSVVIFLNDFTLSGNSDYSGWCKEDIVYPLFTGNTFINKSMDTRAGAPVAFRGAWQRANQDTAGLTDAYIDGLIANNTGITGSPRIIGQSYDGKPDFLRFYIG